MKNYRKRAVALIMAMLMAFGTFSTALAEAASGGVGEINGVALLFAPDGDYAMSPGESLTLTYALLSGNAAYSGDTVYTVEWEVTGNGSSETEITGNTLYVSEYETADELVVTATVYAEVVLASSDSGYADDQDVLGATVGFAEVATASAVVYVVQPNGIFGDDFGGFSIMPTNLTTVMDTIFCLQAHIAGMALDTPTSVVPPASPIAIGPSHNTGSMAINESSGNRFVNMTRAAAANSNGFLVRVPVLPGDIIRVEGRLPAGSPATNMQLQYHGGDVTQVTASNTAAVDNAFVINFTVVDVPNAATLAGGFRIRHTNADVVNFFIDQVTVRRPFVDGTVAFDLQTHLADVSVSTVLGEQNTTAQPTAGNPSIIGGSHAGASATVVNFAGARVLNITRNSSANSNGFLLLPAGGFRENDILIATGRAPAGNITFQFHGSVTTQTPNVAVSANGTYRLQHTVTEAQAATAGVRVRHADATVTAFTVDTFIIFRPTPPAPPVFNCVGSCEFGTGIIAPPTAPADAVRVTNGNALSGTHPILRVNVAELIAGSGIALNDIYGVDVVMRSPGTSHNRWAYIGVNDMRSPVYVRGSSAASGTTQIGVPQPSGNLNTMRFMNIYATADIQSDTVDAATELRAPAPFVATTSGAFNLEVIISNDNAGSVEAIRLLGAPTTTSSRCTPSLAAGCSLLAPQLAPAGQGRCVGTCLAPPILGTVTFNNVARIWNRLSTCDNPVPANQCVFQCTCNTCFDCCVSATSGAHVPYADNCTLCSVCATTLRGGNHSPNFAVNCNHCLHCNRTDLPTTCGNACPAHIPADTTHRRNMNLRAAPYAPEVTILGSALSIGNANASHRASGWFYAYSVNATPTSGARPGSGSQGSGIRTFDSTFPCATGTGEQMLTLQLNSGNNTEHRSYNLSLPVPITANTGRFGIAFDYFYAGAAGPGASPATLSQEEMDRAHYLIGLSDTAFDTPTAGTVGILKHVTANPAASVLGVTTDTHLRIFNNRVTLAHSPETNIAANPLTPGWNTVYALIDTSSSTNNVRWFAAPVGDAPAFHDFAQGSAGVLGSWNNANPINSLSFLTAGPGTATVFNLSRMQVFEYQGAGNFVGPARPYTACGECPDCTPVVSIGAALTLENLATISLSVGEFTPLRRPAVLPANASQAIEWRSSDPTVATVNSTGRVTAVGEGTATIYARTMAVNNAGLRLDSAGVVVTVTPEVRNLIAEWVFSVANYADMPVPVGSSSAQTMTVGGAAYPSGPFINGVLVMPASGGAQAAAAAVRNSGNVRMATEAVPAGVAQFRRVWPNFPGGDAPSASQVARHLTFLTNSQGNDGWLALWGWASPVPAHYGQIEFSTTGRENIALSYDLRRTGGSPPAVLAVEYSVNGGTTWATVVPVVPTVDGVVTPQMHFLPAAANNQASVWVRWCAERTSTNSGSIDFRNIQVFSGMEAPTLTCCNVDDCEICRPLQNLAIYPLPLEVRTVQSRADGAVLGWTNAEFTAAGFAGRAAAGVRYMVVEFNPGETTAGWRVDFQDNSWSEHTVLYSRISQNRTVLPNGVIRYVIDFDNDLPARAGHRGYTSAGLFGTFQIAFGNPDPASGTWYDFRDRIRVAYFTNINPTRHPVVNEIEFASWGTITAHGGNVANVNFLQADAFGRTGIKLTYSFTANTAGIDGIRVQYSIDGGTTWRNIHSAFSIINTPGNTASGTRTEILPVETYGAEDLRIRWIPHGVWGETAWGANTFTVTNARMTRNLQVTEFPRRTSPVISIQSLLGQDVTLDAGGDTANILLPTVTLFSGTDATSNWVSSAPTIVNVGGVSDTHATIRSFGSEGNATIRVSATADASVFTEFDVTVEPVTLDPTIRYLITSPYAGVNWNWTQYRSANHTHSLHSDGTHSVASLAERHWELGFNIVANTDHDRMGITPNVRPQVMSSGNPVDGGSAEGLMALTRIHEMATGTGRLGNPGMLFIPGGNEHSGLGFPGITQRPTGHHVNTYFSFIPNQNTVAGLVTALEAEGRGGVARINHPGRYTGSQHATAWDIAQGIARNPANFLPYADLFASSHNLAGMEIINKFDTESQADRILWDGILSVTMARAIPMPVWGFSDDDSHHNNNIGFSYNLMLMPELNMSEVRNAMDVGAFFAFTRQEREYQIFPGPMRSYFWPGDEGRDGGTSQPALDLPVPRINRITVAGNTITIDATIRQANNITPYGRAYDFDACVAACASICLIHDAFIHWYADGIRIAKGSTIDLAEHQLSVGSYVRASVGHRSYGVLYTQPFEVQIIHAEGADVAPRAIPNLVSFAPIAAPDLSENPTRFALENTILPAAIRIVTNAADNATHPRFATIHWDLSRYDAENPNINDIVGRVMLPTGIRAVTNTNNVDLYRIFTGGCDHNNWGEWAPVSGEAATCVDSGRESRTCQTASCTGEQFRAVAALGHTFGSFVENTPSAGLQTRTCTRAGCGATHTIEMPPHSCDDPRCRVCNPLPPTTELLWELVITQALVDALNAREEFGGVQRAGAEDTNNPVYTYVDGRLQVSARGEDWHSLDVILEDLNLTPTGNYRITVVGTSTANFEALFPIDAGPWELHFDNNGAITTGPVEGTTTGVVMNFLGVVPVAENGVTQEDNPHRIRVRAGGTTTFTITSIIVERVLAPNVCDTCDELLTSCRCCNRCNDYPCTCTQNNNNNNNQNIGGGGGGGFIGGGLGLRPPVTPGEQPSVNDREVVIPEGQDSVTVTSSSLQQLANGGGSLIVSNEYGTVTIPPAALQSIIAQSGANVEVGLVVTESETSIASVEFTVTSGDTTITSFAAPVSISVAIELEEGVNPYRIVATLEDGTIVGGRYDAETGLFTFETAITGSFDISYVENLNRLVVQIGGLMIIDLADNGGNQNMDVPPVIVDGRTLMPVRFMAYALGADVGWNEATREVSLTLNGQTLTFPVDGTITPALAALGMDVPPMIIDGRTMVPLRFISEFFGAIVTWDDATRTIEIIR
jgi:hypothetical protein